VAKGSPAYRRNAKALLRHVVGQHATCTLPAGVRLVRCGAAPLAQNPQTLGVQGLLHTL
jgi:hypothetical protein